MLKEDRAFLETADKNHLLHPAVRFADHEVKGPTIMVGGKGVMVQDISGREYIDGIAGLWLMNVGYGRDEIAEVAYEQTKQLPYFPTFSGNSNIPAIKLAHKLAQIAPDGMNKIHFTSGGSESNDTSMKFARLYHFIRGNEKKTKIISRTGAYHGASMAAAGATGLETSHRGFAVLSPQFRHIGQCYCFRCDFGKTYPGCSMECADAVETAILEEGADTVAAFLAEPVMGVGGVKVPPPEYFPRIREICDKHDVLMIADEVITGFGRTGKMFGVDNCNFTPDLMSCAKGISSGYAPLGASIVHDKVYEVLREDAQAFRHGFTYSGHPVACAVGLKNIEIIEREDLVGNSRDVGAYMMDKIQDEISPHDRVVDVRGMGLIIGIEYADSEGKPISEDDQKKFSEALMKRNLIHRLLAAANITVLQLSPPLVLTKAEADKIVDIVKESTVEVFG